MSSIPIPVRELMTPEPLACTSDVSLREAASLMRDGDCGALPIVDVAARPIGIVTDRDVALAAAKADRPLSQLTAGEAATAPVASCREGEDLTEALKLMAGHQVRRLPVTNEEGRLVGMLTVSDVFEQVATRAAPSGTLPAEPAVITLQQICARP